MDHAIATALDNRPGDATAPMDAAAELAERFGATGKADSLGFGSGRSTRGGSGAYYWVHYGRVLAQLRGRRDDAVRALRTAEDIYPTKVRRDPLVRDVIATLLPGTRRDAIGTELRRMAHRAGLPM